MTHDHQPRPILLVLATVIAVAGCVAPMADPSVAGEDDGVTASATGGDPTVLPAEVTHLPDDVPLAQLRTNGTVDIRLRNALAEPVIVNLTVTTDAPITAVELTFDNGTTITRNRSQFPDGMGGPWYVIYSDALRQPPAGDVVDVDPLSGSLYRIQVTLAPNTTQTLRVPNGTARPGVPELLFELRRLPAGRIAQSSSYACFPRPERDDQFRYLQVHYRFTTIENGTIIQSALGGACARS